MELQMKHIVLKQEEVLISFDITAMFTNIHTDLAKSIIENCTNKLRDLETSLGRL